MTTNDHPAVENGPPGTPPDPGGKNGKSGHRRPVAARMEVAALLVAGGRTLKETAAESGVGERTLRRWLAGDAAFLLKLKECRTAIFGEAVGRLTTLGGQAAAVLGALLASE